VRSRPPNRVLSFFLPTGFQPAACGVVSKSHGAISYGCGVISNGCDVAESAYGVSENGYGAISNGWGVISDGKLKLLACCFLAVCNMLTAGGCPSAPALGALLQKAIMVLHVTFMVL
jgi:hypothetical protein